MAACNGRCVARNDRLGAPVIILDADDIVFSEIAAGLDSSRILPRFFETVHGRSVHGLNGIMTVTQAAPRSGPNWVRSVKIYVGGRLSLSFSQAR
jgi:hypothetical protein